MSKENHGLHYSILRKLLVRQINRSSALPDKTVKAAYERLFGDGKQDPWSAGKEVADAILYLERIIEIEKLRTITELDRYFEQFDRQNAAYVDKYEKADALDRIALEYSRLSPDSLICSSQGSQLQPARQPARLMTMY